MAISIAATGAPAAARRAASAMAEMATRRMAAASAGLAA